MITEILVVDPSMDMWIAHTDGLDSHSLYTRSLGELVKHTTNTTLGYSTKSSVYHTNQLESRLVASALIFGNSTCSMEELHTM
jgi:hypothetical protein